MRPEANQPPPDYVIPPATLFVRHRDEIVELDGMCPDMWPYSHAAQHRAMGRLADDDPGPMRFTGVVTGELVEVTGSGVDRDNPMHCPQMEPHPLPRCTCASALTGGLDGDASAPWPKINVVDGGGIDTGRSDG